MHVHRLFPPWSIIYDHLKDYLGLFWEFRTRHAIFFMDIVALPPLLKGLCTDIILLCAVFTLCVLYQPFE